MSDWLADTQESYDTVAVSYAEWLRTAGFTVEAQWLLGTDGAVLFARRE